VRAADCGGSWIVDARSHRAREGKDGEAGAQTAPEWEFKEVAEWKRLKTHESHTRGCGISLSLRLRDKRYPVYVIIPIAHAKLRKERRLRVFLRHHSVIAIKEPFKAPSKRCFWEEALAIIKPGRYT